MKVGVDYDATLADTHGLVLQLINWKHGTKIKRADWDSWTFLETIGLMDDFWALYDMMDSGYLRRAVAPTDPLACAAVKWLMKRGHEVVVVTSNDPKCVPSISAWLFGHGLGEVPVLALGRGSSKQKVAQEFDLFIDDSPSMVQAILEYNAENPRPKQLLLITQPWNATIPLPETTTLIQRLTLWTEFFEKLIAWGY